MKNLLLCLLWLFSIPLFSQSNSAVGILIGGDISLRVFYGEDVSGEKTWDQEKANFRFGLNYEHRLTDKTWFKTGVRLAKVGFVDLHLTGLRWGTQHDGSGGHDPTTSGDIKRTINYSFLEIPAMIRFELLEGKWQPFFELGIANNFYLKTTSKLTGDLGNKTSKTREKEVNKYQLSGIISAGINYVLSEKYKLFLQPVYRHHITQVNDANSEIHLISFGAEIGARLHLK